MSNRSRKNVNDAYQNENIIKPAKNSNYLKKFTHTI